MVKERKMWVPSRFMETDAIAYRPKIVGDDRGHAGKNYVAKRDKKSKGDEVVFDPAGHKEYLTGFHKRKVARRNKAVKEQLTKGRKDLLVVRAKKRAELKLKLGLDDKWGVEDSSEDDKEQDDNAKNVLAQVRYGDVGVMTTVTTVALDSGPEDESGSSDSEEEGSKLRRKPVFNTGGRANQVQSYKFEKQGSGTAQPAMTLDKAAIKAATASAGVQKKKKKKTESTKGKGKAQKKYAKSE
eukprot:gene14074-20021_t